MASTSLAVIRTLTIRAKTEGVDQSAASLDKLAGSTDKVAKSSTTMERATASAEKSFQRFERSVDPAARAQAKLAEASKQLQRAQEQGLVSSARAGDLMQKAIAQHNSAGTAAKQHSQALQELSSVGQNLSGNLGTIGGILARMGPAGLAAAGVFGGLALAMTAAATAALGLADHAGKLVDLSDSIGITVTGLQALQEAASQVGVSEEQLSTQLEKFSAVLGNLRDSNKGAIETFDRLGEGFAQQVANATSFEEALNLVYAQVNKLDTAAKSAALKELFGKGATGQGRIAQLISDAQGIQGFLAQMDKAGILTRKQAEEFDKLGDAINRAFKVAGLEFTKAFAGPTLTNLDVIAKQFVVIARLAGELAAPLASAFGGEVLTNINSVRDALTEFVAALEGLSDAEKRSKIGDALVDPRLVQTIGDIIQLFKDLIAVVQAAAAALSGFLSSPFSLSSVTQIWTDMSTAVGNAQESMRRLGTSLTTEGTRGAVALNEVKVSADGVDKAIDNIVTGIPKDLGLKPEIAAPLKPVKLAFDDVGKSAGKAAKTVKEEVSPAIQELSQVAGQLGSALVSALLKGDNAAKALKSTLQGVASSATSGAITKLIQGDFAGAAVSGGIALASAVGSFLFGDDEEEEKAQQQAAEQAAAAARAAAEALQQARDAFAGLSREIQDFTNTANGTTIGELTQALADFSDQSVRLQEAAIAAQNDTALEAIRQTAAAGMNRFLRQFLNDVDALISEFGTEGIMQEARESVRDLMSQYSSLQDSIDEFARRTGADISILRQNLQTSAIRALLDMLGDQTPISETASEMQRLKGIASELDDALVALGVSAEDAAVIVETRLNASLQKLATNFLDPLIREVNELAGGGWINEAQDLFNRVKQLNADAAALGISTTLIQELYVRSAQAIVDSNQLVGDSFLRLQRMLGLAGTGLHEFNAAIEETADVVVRSAREIADAIQSNEDRLFMAMNRGDSLQAQLARFDLQAQREREAEIRAGGQALASLERAIAQERVNIITDFAAAQAEAAQRAAEEAARARQQQIEAEQRAAEEKARILKEAVDFIAGQVRRIQDFIADFLSGPDSILKPSQQLATAQQRFASELAAAASGNRDALSNITGNAQNVIDAVRRYYGSSAAGQGLIQQLLGQLQGLPSQLSPEEFIVEGLTEPIDNLGDTITDVTVDQTQILAALLQGLKLALQSGDANAFALALLPMFDRLDTTMDQALSFQELVTGLGSDVNLQQLRAIFTELDTNGDQLLQKSELIRAAAAGTQTGVTQSNTTLDAIRVQTAFLSFIANMLTSINLHVETLEQIRASLLTIAAWQPGSNHASGGWITGGTPGRDSVSGMLMPGEFVVRESVARQNPWLESFNETGRYPANDNGQITAAIIRVEHLLLRGFRALIETELQTAGIIAKPIQEANKITRTRRGEKKKTA